MVRFILLALTALPFPLLGRATVVAPGPIGAIAVRVDSARRVVVLSAGAFDLPVDQMATSDSDGSMNAHMLAIPLLRFTWPVDGWIRSLKIRVTDRAGHQLSRTLVHHLLVINFGRRELLYPQAERIIAVGRETEDLRFPATIGIPVRAVTPMAMTLGWHNDGHEPVVGATVEVAIEWTPANTVPRPTSVLPVPVNLFNPIGWNGEFDLPAGPGRWTADVSLPISGRIVFAGGHEHDYGKGFEFQEVTGGIARSVFKLGTRLTPDGHLIAVDRVMPGAAGAGIKLSAGHVYRLVATYDNPTGKTLVNGAMANLILLFAPDQIEKWPALDPNDPEYRRDVRTLETMGATSAHDAPKGR